VEAWSIVVPWIGFPLSALLDRVKPLPNATYLKFTSWSNPSIASDLAGAFPWPYTEGLTVSEAMNELAFMSVGSYGAPLLPQQGEPIRLTIPWKYGFKSAKAIVHIELVATRPTTFWEGLNSKEYGFWCNVNPAVTHPRWTQAVETPLGGSATTKTVNTQLFNGYTNLVSYLYANLQNEPLYK